MPSQTIRALALAIIICGSIVSGPVALGRQETPDPMDLADEPGLTFTFTPTVYIPRLGGHSRLGPSPAARSISLESNIDLRDREYVFNPELTIATDSPWAFFVHGLAFDTDGNGTYRGIPSDFGSLSLSPGTPYSASLDLTTVMGEVAYLFCQWQTDDRAVEFAAGPVLDVRWVDVEQTITTAMSRESPDGSWVGVLGGVKVNLRLDFEPYQLPILRALELEGVAAVGPALGADGGTMWNLRVGLTGYVTDNIGLVFGYRLIEIDAEDGDYEFEGGLQGILFGASIRF